eukprot:SAG22_NODE_3275_length_1811_cov_2.363902_1_plen_232_part_00
MCVCGGGAGLRAVCQCALRASEQVDGWVRVRGFFMQAGCRTIAQQWLALRPGAHDVTIDHLPVLLDSHVCLPQHWPACREDGGLGEQRSCCGDANEGSGAAGHAPVTYRAGDLATFFQLLDQLLVDIDAGFLREHGGKAGGTWRVRAGGEGRAAAGARQTAEVRHLACGADRRGLRAGHAVSGRHEDEGDAGAHKAGMHGRSKAAAGGGGRRRQSAKFRAARAAPSPARGN